MNTSDHHYGTRYAVKSLLPKHFNGHMKLILKHLLFYNDYNEINPVKRQKIIKLVKDLKAKGIPIHGIGLQGHWAVNEPSKDQLDQTLKDFSGFGLTMQVTELDISVYPKEHNARDRKAEDNDTAFTAEKEKKQIEVYKTCFDLFKKYIRTFLQLPFGIFLIAAVGLIIFR